MQKVLLFLVLTPVIVYGAVCIAAYFWQDNLLFFPQPPESLHYATMARNATLENWKVQTSDGNSLDGWAQIFPKSRFTILYFWGNAEESSFFVDETAYSGANIVSFNYRGYGKSTGKPSEKALFSDALEIYEYLVTVKKIAPENLIVMGRSLGSGIATYLASQKPARKVILITPYDSIENVAKDTYGYLPVSLLIRHRFESAKYAMLKSNEMLCIYGGKDDIIRNPRTEKLLTSWNGTVQKVFLPTADHHSILQFKETKQAIDDYIK